MLFSERPRWRLIAFALFWSGVSLISYAGETIPIHTIIEQFPRILYVDLERNMLSFITGNKIYVYDLETGEQRWWKPSNYKGEHYNTSIGKDYIVMFTEEVFVVLDKTTGNEVWREEMSDWQRIEYARFEAESNLIRLRCEGGLVLYDLDSRQGYRLPFEKYTNYSGMMPDGTTLYAFKGKEDDPPPSNYEALFWKPGDRQPVKRFTLESPGELHFRGVAGNMFIFSDFLYKRTPEHILRAYDATTGEMVREYSQDPLNTMPRYYCWVPPNNECIFWLDDSGKHLYKMETASGECTFAAIPENFTMVYGGIYSTFADSTGNWWYLAWDETRNICLFPFNHVGAPRKLLDGSRFLPGSNCSLSPPWLTARNYFATESSTDLYRLQDMQKIARWKGYQNSPSALISNDMRYSVTTFSKEEGISRRDTAYVYSREQTEPLFTVKGSPKAVSPDGQYAVILENDGYYSYKPGSTYKDYEEYRKNNPEKSAIHVIDIPTQKVVARYDARYSRADTAFSEDSRYLAILSNDELKVIDTMQEFREIPLFLSGRKDLYFFSMEFSTDGQRLLASGYGEAFLFDVAAGKHLFTITEKARFKNRYSADSGTNILRKIESTAMEFLGRYTDRFKNKPELRATFSKDDKQIITVAQDMLIRFWDANTGALLRTLDPQLPEERNIWGQIENSIILSKDGAYALAYNQNGFDSGTLWDLERGIKVRCYTFLGASRVDAALSDNADRVYAMINGDLYFLDGAKLP